MNIPVLVVDDHEIVRSGIVRILRDTHDIGVVGIAGDGRAAVGEAARLNPKVVLMDIHMPGMNGMEATWRILADCPETKVLALSMYADASYVEGMLDAGASGYILKSCSVADLVGAIRCVARGGTYMGQGLAYRPAAVLQPPVEGRDTNVSAVSWSEPVQRRN